MQNDEIKKFFIFFQKPIDRCDLLVYNDYSKTKEDKKMFRITYVDGIEKFIEVVDRYSFSNFIMGLDCCGCEILEIEVIKGE